MEKTAHKKNLRRLAPVRLGITLLCLLAVALIYALRVDEGAMLWVYEHVTHPYHLFMSKLCSHFAFSAAELVYAAAILGLAAYLLWCVYRLIRFPEKLWQLYRLVLTLAMAGAVFWAGLSVMWTPCYYAPGFAGEPQSADAPAGAPVAAADETDPSVGMCADEQDRQARPDTDTPSELERRYILHLMSFAAGAQSPAAPPERQAVRPQSADAPAVPAAEPAENIGETERARGRAEEPPRRTQLKKAAAARDIPRAGSAGAARLRKASFYEQAAPQIDKLFRDNPHHAELEKLLPDTRWVRVDFDGKSYYAVGLIGARPDFVGYAVPAAYTPEPPEELDGYAVWVPRDPAGPAGDGYWVMYQDAVTGASVKNDPGAAETR